MCLVLHFSLISQNSFVSFEYKKIYSFYLHKFEKFNKNFRNFIFFKILFGFILVYATLRLTYRIIDLFLFSEKFYCIYCVFMALQIISIIAFRNFQNTFKLRIILLNFNLILFKTTFKTLMHFIVNIIKLYNFIYKYKNLIELKYFVICQWICFNSIDFHGSIKLIHFIKLFGLKQNFKIKRKCY